MPLHPQSQFIINFMDSLGDKPFEEDTPQNARDIRNARTTPSTLPIFETKDIDAGGVPARLYKPNNNTNLPLLVYYHGGGWVLGNVDSHDGICRALAMQSECAVLSVEYRLAPEFPFPIPLTDSVTATRWAYDNAASIGCDASRIAVGGDSAGGNFAAIIANMQVIPCVYQLLIYPVTDCRMGTESYVENAAGPFLRSADMAAFIDLYIGDITSPEDPRVSPIMASPATLASCPPAVIITAGHDPLRDEGEQYGHALIANGVEASIVRYFGMFHGFFSLFPWLDDGKAAVSQVSSAIRSALAPPRTK
jgi:acetyl esterase